MNLSSYSKSELATALKALKSYRSLEKFVGRRGRAIFARAQSGEKLYRVEYFGEEDRGAIESLALGAYATHFGETVSPSVVEWRRNDNIHGGIRIFS